MIRTKSGERGQTLVEFALVLPILLLLLLGIFEFGRIFHATLVLEQAAREGARTGAIHKTDMAIETAVDGQVASLDPAQLTVIISPAAGDRNTGETLTVHLDYQLHLMTPMIAAIVGNPLELEAEASMRIE